MATNYVFVDSQNVPCPSHPIIGEKDVIFTLLMGPTQKKLDADLVERLLSAATSVQLIRLKSSAKNALDFALSFYAGRASALDPSGYIHVVTKDKGFDPLVEHLRTKGIKARRHESFETLSFTAVPQRKEEQDDDPFEKALEHLRKSENNRPKKKKALISHLANLFSKALEESDLRAIIDRLHKGGHLRIDGKEAVTYTLKKK